MSIKLFDFQKDLIRKANPNYMYITDTGTGKTYISLFHFLKFRKPNQKLVVIAPAAKIKEKGWERESNKIFSFFNKNIETEFFTYDKFARKIKEIYDNKDALELKKYMNCFLILDEAHYIKNKQSVRSKIIKFFIKKTNANFILLTATPTPQGYIDYGNYLEIFGKTQSAYAYEKRFGIVNGYLLKNKNIRVIEDFKDKHIIDEMFNSFSSKPLKKEDCLDLPSLTMDKWYFDVSKEYKVLEYIINKLPNEYFKSNIAMSKLPDNEKELIKNKCKEIILNTEALVRSKLKNTDFITNKFLEELYSENSNITSNMKAIVLQRQYANLRDKIEYIEDFISNTKDNILIFYNFNIEYECLVEMIKNFNKKNKHMKKTVFSINGTKKEIVPIKDHNSISNSITLVQIQSGAAAIELQYCNEVIYFTPTWNYADYYQSLGRAYRHGQKHKVSVHFMLTNDTFELKVYEKLMLKEDFDIKRILKRNKNKNSIV